MRMTRTIASAGLFALISVACGSSSEPAPSANRAGTGATLAGALGAFEWSCKQDLDNRDNCVCQQASFEAKDTCAAPKPTCCVMATLFAPICICAPEGTQGCENLRMGSTNTPVAQCPP